MRARVLFVVLCLLNFKIYAHKKKQQRRSSRRTFHRLGRRLTSCTARKTVVNHIVSGRTGGTVGERRADCLFEHFRPVDWNTIDRECPLPPRVYWRQWLRGKQRKYRFYYFSLVICKNDAWTEWWAEKKQGHRSINGRVTKDFCPFFRRRAKNIICPVILSADTSFWLPINVFLMYIRRREHDDPDDLSSWLYHSTSPLVLLIVCAKPEKEVIKNEITTSTRCG